MKRKDKVDLLTKNRDFCEGLGLSGKSKEFKIEYLGGFKDKEIDEFYYEFVDPQ